MTGGRLARRKEFFVFGQVSTSKDYFNKNVQTGQLSTTKHILRLIEKELVDSVLLYVDTEYLKRNADLKSQLTVASKQIQKVVGISEVSEGLIVFEENHNVYRCVYYDNKTEYQLVDIHFYQGDPNSKVAKFAFKDSKTLMKEKKDRAVGNKDAMPPPMPPEK